VASRGFQWGIFRTSGLAGAVGTVEFNMGSTFQTEQGVASLRGMTITRMIAQLTLRPVTPLASGLLSYSAACLVVGSNSNPNLDPQDQNADYFWHSIGGISLQGSETAVGVFGADTYISHIDVRAQRKISGMEASPWFILRNPTGTNMTYDFSGRLLYRLP